MKLIALGDTHGRTDWRRIVSGNESDKLVLVGDYFDAKEDITAEQQMDNFRELLSYKQANREKAILLFGNHDYHYLDVVHETYSGFQKWKQAGIRELLREAMRENLLQMCFVHENYVFTHAGITKTWASNNNVDLTQGGKSIENQINDLFRHKPIAFGFTIGENFSFSGDDICQSPIWVRPNSLRKDRTDGFVQIVGHTPQRKLVIDDSIVLIDTLGTSGEYLVITDGEMAVGNPEL